MIVPPPLGVVASADGWFNVGSSATTFCWFRVPVPRPPTLMLKARFCQMTLLYSPGYGTCAQYSYPGLYNNVIWQNRAFNISVGGLGTGTLNQQNVVALLPTLNQPSADATTPNGGGTIITGGSGACVTSGSGGARSVSYWDLGVRGDTGPDNHASGVTLAPSYSVLTDVST